MNEALTKAFLQLEEIPNLKIWDLAYNNKKPRWEIYFSVRSRSNERIPEITYWYCLVDENYPYGEIRIFPCAEKGITDTYFHQERNLKLPSLKFRSGKLCLDYAYDGSGAKIKQLQEYGKPDRLVWQFERAIKWIEDAVADNLILSGDAMELPDFGCDPYAKTIGFVSSSADLDLFRSNEIKIGTFEYTEVANKFYIATTFYDSNGTLVFDIDGSQYSSHQKPKGVWFFLEKPLTINNWQAPFLISEIVTALTEQGKRFDSLLASAISNEKKGEKINYIAFGWPLSKEKNSPEVAIHWQFLEMPQLEMSPKGFRNHTESLVLYHIEKWARNSTQAKWIKSKNIEPSNLYSRIPEFNLLGNANFVIIGLGSLGSSFTDALARSGGMKFTLVDGDMFTDGNLCRHVLDMNAIGEKKVDSMKAKINLINPFANVRVIRNDFSSTTDLLLDESSIILDFSSEESAVHAIELYAHEKKGFYVNCSFGAEKANPVYCYFNNVTDVTLDKYKSKIQPHLKDINPSEVMRIEGMGCWSTVFPASIFDVQYAAYRCINFLMACMTNPIEKFTVYNNLKDSSGESY